MILSLPPRQSHHKKRNCHPERREGSAFSFALPFLRPRALSTSLRLRFLYLLGLPCFLYLPNPTQPDTSLPLQTLPYQSLPHSFRRLGGVPLVHTQFTHSLSAAPQIFPESSFPLYLPLNNFRRILNPLESTLPSPLATVHSKRLTAPSFLLESTLTKNPGGGPLLFSPVSALLLTSELPASGPHRKRRNPNRFIRFRTVSVTPGGGVTSTASVISSEARNLYFQLPSPRFHGSPATCAGYSLRPYFLALRCLRALLNGVNLWRQKFTSAFCV